MAKQIVIYRQNIYPGGGFNIMISPIQLTPNMDINTLVTALNDMFRQIEADNRTQIIKDEDGKNRILIGRGPKGNYVVAISKKGVDVLQALEK